MPRWTAGGDANHGAIDSPSVRIDLLDQAPKVEAVEVELVDEPGRRRPLPRHALARRGRG